MAYSFQKNLHNIVDFERYVQELLEKYALASNLPLDNNISLSSSQNIETNTIDLTFSTNLTPGQYAVFEKALQTYIEPEDKTLYKTIPYVMSEKSIKCNEFSVISNFIYQGSDYTETLKKIKINGRINSINSNSHYSLRVVDISNNIIMGFNNFFNTNFEYGVIPLSNIPYNESTIEIQGKKDISATSFEINGVELAYIFR